MAPPIAPIIANYTVPCSQLPRYLYFVEHSQSQAHRNNQGDFEAADQWTPLRGLDHLYPLMLEHVDWSNRRPTPFISTFGDYNHALNWARQRRPWAIIHKIDTEKLGNRDCWAFYALAFTLLGFEPDLICFESEFLFLYTIPSSAIVSSMDLGSVRK
ncbi:hypothetical protein QBC45DRAFT_339459 [Copromyces sp. CBS 386.78]|nr:hypothetical protein QBC45DRAFT_339459 [Copromyces sp. CBS 386.78]